MYQDLQKTPYYTKKMALLCLLLVLSGFGCILFGYLCLPFSAASYASLLHFEKKTRRILSYVLPVAIYTVNVLINGFFSLEGVIYIAVGVLFFFFNEKGRTKRETVFFITLAISIFIFLSFFALAFTVNESLSFSALKAYYRGLYDSLKRSFISLMTSISSQDEEGSFFFLLTRENAEDVFHSLILSLPSFVIIFAFFLAGLTYKIYDFLRVRLFGASRSDLELFVPTKFLAYSYIVVAILSLFSSSGSDVFALTITNVNNVLLVVFAYFGLKISYTLIKHSRGTAFALLLVLVAFAFFTTTAITLLSFIGVFFALGSVERIKGN